MRNPRVVVVRHKTVASNGMSTETVNDKYPIPRQRLVTDSETLIQIDN